MRDTRLNLTEIGAELEFPDSAAFSRFFRHHTGVPARDFRKRMLAMTKSVEIFQKPEKRSKR
jgi:AraC-like DNA-binding protein